MKENNRITVSKLNSMIKEVFEDLPFFKNIVIEGEISNYKGKNISGHYYFTLKDEESVIRCVMFKYDSLYQKMNFKDGDKVIITSNLSVYPPSGSYQLICKKIELFGEGDILFKKQQLIAKLNVEGLFDKKKKIPKFPNKIGIIVGKNSAAEKDIEFNLIRRWNNVTLNFYYALVQGDNAYKDIINKVIEADNDNLDLLIIARGGGSVEDLSAFDNEELIRTISKIKTPLISAVGHEINRSITDLIADQYASTPTAAAELAVPDKKDILEDLSQQSNFIKTLMNNKISALENKLFVLSNNKYLKSVNEIYLSLENKIEQYKKDVQNNINSYLINKNHLLEIKINNINNLNPKNILEKGYTLILDKDDNTINDAKQIKENTDAKIIFYNDEIDVTIKRR